MLSLMPPLAHFLLKLFPTRGFVGRVGFIGARANSLTPQFEFCFLLFSFSFERDRNF